MPRWPGCWKEGKGLDYGLKPLGDDLEAPRVYGGS